MSSKYKIVLAFISFLIVSSTFYFKWKTESFFSMSEKAKREVVRHQIQLRKNDLSTSSLTASCKDINQTYQRLMHDISQSKSPCVIKFKNSIKILPADSAVLVVMQEIYKHVDYTEKKIIEGQLYTYAYAKESCIEPIRIQFEKNSNNDFLIVEIKNFPAFLNCQCLN